jgi:spermidine/putrescine transport system permease protein
VSALGVDLSRLRRRAIGTARPRPHGGSSALLAGNAWIVFAFLYLPIVVLTILSFNDNRLVGVWGGASLRWYRELAADAAVLSALRNSLTVAVDLDHHRDGLGTAAAISLERFRWRGQRTFDGMLFLPVIIPDVTMAVMMLLFFVQVFRLAGEPVRDHRHVRADDHHPLARRVQHLLRRRRRPRTTRRARARVLEEAAADLYASRWQTFRT